VTRRFALFLVALASTAIVLAACGAQAPAAPPLSDPKEILAKTVLSLKDVKTVEFTGALTGSLDSPSLGGKLDLSTVKMNGALDIPNKKAKFSLDAPTLVGTKIDALLIDKVAYYKVAGMLAGMMGGTTTDKFTKVDVPASSTNPITTATDTAKLAADLQAGLDKLPTPPTKGADEKCGDTDCYHVTLKLTAADIKALSPTTAATDGEFSLDVWTRKNDLRPAKIGITITSAQTGTVGMTMDFKYDVTVSVDAPPADQIAP
jgi:hypothetical protein